MLTVFSEPVVFLTLRKMVERLVLGGEGHTCRQTGQKPNHQKWVGWVGCGANSPACFQLRPRPKSRSSSEPEQSGWRQTIVLPVAGSKRRKAQLQASVSLSAGGGEFTISAKSPLCSGLPFRFVGVFAERKILIDSFHGPLGTSRR